MTRVFTEAGDHIPVTVIAAGPCPILKVKTQESDGYDAVVLGYGETRKKLVSKPLQGFFDKVAAEPVRHIQELRLPEPEEELKAGDVWTVEEFQPGDNVRVTGTSKGRGFAGAMKRHGFSGAQKTHGQSDRWRAPGSIGQSSYPSRVFKGQRMAGRMGNEKVTVRNITVVDIDTEKNLLILKGSIPGPRNGFIIVRKQGKSPQVNQDSQGQEE